MFAFRPSACWLKEGGKAGLKSKHTQQAIKQHLAKHGKKLERSSKLPVIPTCPEPTCECADMPGDLDIEREKDLNGTMAAYSQQILISTGQADWQSRIEDEKDTAPWGTVVAGIKEMLGPKGRFHDPYRNVVVSTSSFGTDTSQAPRPSEALLFPSFQKVSNIDSSNPGMMQFVETFVSSKDRAAVPEEQRKQLDSAGQQWSGEIKPISAPTILVCSHNSRDNRCGILGPLLHAEFVQYLNKRQTLRNQAVSNAVVGDQIHDEGAHTFASHPVFRPDVIDAEHKSQQPVNVGMISHIGGHKWAGNIIIYVPPDYKLGALEREARGRRPRDRVVTGQDEAVDVPEDEAISPEELQEGLSPLAGKGIWYGRVEPKHVEGIVEQTLGHGQIIRELFRGGINYDGSPLRIS